MPMYQYACRDCGQAFEKRLKMSQASKNQVCPACGSEETRKRISAVALNGVNRPAQAVAPMPAPSPFS